MGKEPIMVIYVKIDRSNCPEMTMPDGKVKICLTPFIPENARLCMTNS